MSKLDVVSIRLVKDAPIMSDKPIGNPIAAVELLGKQTELYGYLNHYGDWAIAPIYPNAKSFDNDGYAVVKSPEGGWGVINRAAEWVIAPNFESSLDASSALRRLTR